jgi:hypothetical protein
MSRRLLTTTYLLRIRSYHPPTATESCVLFRVCHGEPDDLDLDYEVRKTSRLWVVRFLLRKLRCRFKLFVHVNAT